MKKTLPIFLFLLSLFWISCTEKKGNRLIGKWQQVAIINPQLEETMHDQLIFADTVGSTTDSLQNFQLYGTDNIDTFKSRAKANLDSFRKQQFFAIEKTIFEFRPDGIILIHSADGSDSANWYFDEEKALILDKQKLKGTGLKKSFELKELSDTALKLQFNEQFQTKTLVFKPVKK